MRFASGSGTSDAEEVLAGATLVVVVVEWGEDADAIMGGPDRLAETEAGADEGEVQGDHLHHQEDDRILDLRDLQEDSRDHGLAHGLGPFHDRLLYSAGGTGPLQDPHLRPVPAPPGRGPERHAPHRGRPLLPAVAVAEGVQAQGALALLRGPPRGQDHVLHRLCDAEAVPRRGPHLGLDHVHALHLRVVVITVRPRLLHHVADCPGLAHDQGALGTAIAVERGLSYRLRRAA